MKIVIDFNILISAGLNPTELSLKIYNANNNLASVM